MAPKRALANCLIVLVGDFGPQRTYKSLRRWIEGQGGTVSTSITGRTTHLVCSRACWEENHPSVKEASKHKNTAIVSYDWLEDSLLKHCRKRVSPYLWHHSSRRKSKMDTSSPTLVDKDSQEQGKKPETTSKLSEQDLISKQYHVYQDGKGPVYDVVLTRTNSIDGRRESCRLCVHEHNTLPLQQYACTLTFTPEERSPLTSILASPGGSFTLSSLVFREIFKHKTGVAWEMAIQGSVERKKDGQEQLNAGGDGGKEEAKTGDCKDYYSYSFGESNHFAIRKKNGK